MDDSFTREVEAACLVMLGVAAELDMKSGIDPESALQDGHARLLRWQVSRFRTALADRLSEREGWVMVPRKALPAMLEQAAFNLCAEYGVDFVKPLGKFVEDAYEELVSAASALPSPPGKLGR